MQDVFTGKNATLTLAASQTPEGDATSAVLAGYGLTSGTAIARLTAIEVYVDTALEEFHQIGQRYATSLHPGDIHIHGKVGQAYINGALLFLLLGKGGLNTNPLEQYVQPNFDIIMSLTNPAILNPAAEAKMTIKGVKFATWMNTIPEDGFVMQNLTFKAIKINVDDTGDGVFTPIAFK